MSSLEMRSRPVRMSIRLETRLMMLGIKIPDQSNIRHMMEATRLRLPPSTSWPRLKIAWYRRWMYSAEQYHAYTYDEFTRLNANSERIAHLWGGMPPEEVVKNVERIRERIPEAKCYVHATKDDPWLEVRLGHERYFIHCWMRSGPHEEIVLVI